MPPTKILKEKDANRKILAGKIFAVVGFGAQGSAFAANLRDCGFDVLVGLRPKSASAEIVRRANFKLLSVADAVRKSDIVIIAVPDAQQAKIYAEDIEPNLDGGKTLVFLNALSVQAGLVVPKKDVNAVLVWPKAPGIAVRSMFLENMGVPAFIAVWQGGKLAREIALAVADAVGSTRAGVIESTFKECLEPGLFGEQAVVCGGLVSLVRSGFETLVEAGYKPEMAYFECCHELKFIVDLICQRGVSGMRMLLPETAKYGGITRGSRVVSDKSKREMNKILGEIKSGKFAKEWLKENDSGLKNYAKLLAKSQQHPMEKVGQRLRSLMPWSAKQNVKGAGAAYSSRPRGKA